MERVVGTRVSFTMAQLKAKVMYHQMVVMGSQILRSWPNLSCLMTIANTVFKMNLCISC